MNGFQVGGVGVRVTAERHEDLDLPDVLRCFTLDAASPAIDLNLERVPKLIPESQYEIFDSGAIWKLFRRDSQFCFDFTAPLFGKNPYKRLLVDEQFRRATLLLNQESFSRFAGAVSPLDYPLDELLITHRLTQEKAVELHACGIVLPDGTGNLFVGHSGAGKSTTTRLWTAHQDVLVLSDDRIIVRREDLLDKNPGRVRMYGTPWHGDAMYASPESAPIRRILILEHGRGNVLTRLSSAEAVAELFARSFVPQHCHDYVQSALQFLQQVVEEIPCYRFTFEPNEGAVNAIFDQHEFRDRRIKGESSSCCRQ